MKQRTMDEMISYFNQQVSEMDIKHEDKIKLLGMIAAIGYEVQKCKWIPCSERLPEKSGRYLVTRGLNAAGSLWNRVYIANYSDLMGLIRQKIFWVGNVGKSDFERLDDVISWMPLPEPWKGDSND